MGWCPPTLATGHTHATKISDNALMPTSPIVRWRAPLVAATAIAVLFASIFLAALGSPSPRDIPVALVGSQEQARQLEAQLNEQAEEGFDVQSVLTAKKGKRLLGDRDVYGVLDPTAEAGPTIYVAGFNGAALNGAVQGALSPAAGVMAATAPRAQGGIKVIQVDTHKGKGKPTSVFYIVFGMVIAGMAFTVASGALTPMAAVGGVAQRLIATIVTAFVVGISVSGVAWLFDALPGGYVQVALIAGLLMAALALSIQGLALILGPPGLILSAVFFIMIGNAASGAAVHKLLLGTGWRELSPLLPTGAGATAIVNVSAFPGASSSSPMLVLAAWAVIGSVLVAVGVKRRATAEAE